MERYLEIAARSFVGYARYVLREVTEPGLGNYFYLLIAVSLLCLAFENVAPWRREQPRVRRGFWLDAFYMFWNFFLFSMLGYAAVADVVAAVFHDLLALVGVATIPQVDLTGLPVVVQLLVLFVLRDFIQFQIHRLLHAIPWLWEFHKVHHSVVEMGFAAHLRYHPMETVVYRTLEYVPLAALGFSVTDFFAVHAVALLIGHFNHSNFRLPMGPLRYLFNSPEMHIWHHARSLPRRNGVNFGLSLSLWDYLFRTAYVPRSGRDESLGFEAIESYPTTFLGHLWAPLRRKT